MATEDQKKAYAATLKKLQEEQDPEIDLVLDTTAEDVEWLRAGRRRTTS